MLIPPKGCANNAMTKAPDMCTSNQPMWQDRILWYHDLAACRTISAPVISDLHCAM